jgi:hypothetical protein
MSLNDNYLDKLKQQFGRFTNCKKMPIHELIEICIKLNIGHDIFDTQADLCNKIKQKLFTGIQAIDTTNFECNDHTLQELVEMAKVLDIIVDNKMTKEELCNRINNKLNITVLQPHRPQPKLMDSTYFDTAKQTLSDLFVAKPIQQEEQFVESEPQETSELTLQTVYEPIQEETYEQSEPIQEETYEQSEPIQEETYEPEQESSELTVLQEPEISPYLENRIQEIINHENEIGNEIHDTGSLGLDHSLKKIENLNNDNEEPDMVTLDLDNLDTLNLDDLDLDLGSDDDEKHDVSQFM